MKSYRLFEHGKPLTLADMPTPEPKGTQVLLKVRASGVCHSDLHIWEGSYDLGNGKRLMLKDRGIPLPLTMGHETVGDVVAAGPEASGVKPGDVRLVYPWIGCGECAVCKAGEENLCTKPRSLGVYTDGGYSDYMLVPHAKYLLDLKGIDPVVAAPYACSGLTTYSALKKLDYLLAREPILIIGAGGLGLMAVTLLKAMGGKGAIVVDIDSGKRDVAMQAGALAAIDGTAPDAMAQIAKETGGALRGAIDLVGAPSTSALAFDSLVKGGKLVMVGLFGGASPWSLPLIPIKAITIQGSYVGNLRELQELLDMVREKKVQSIPITTRHFHEASDTLEDLRLGRLVGRAVLTP